MKNKKAEFQQKFENSVFTLARLFPSFQMTTYPSHFAQSLAGSHAGAMAYLKASPSYHMNGLALGMSHGLDALQSQSLHYGGGNNFRGSQPCRNLRLLNI